MTVRLNKNEERILNDFQRDFPLEPRPYGRIAGNLGITEEELLEILADLKKRNVVSRIGPVVKPQSVGASTLAAMQVPKSRLSKVAEIVSGFEAVNHNYEREHRLNLWFVVTAVDEAGVQAVLDKIEEQTGLPVISLPLLTSFHIDLGFELK